MKKWTKKIVLILAVFSLFIGGSGCENKSRAAIQKKETVSQETAASESEEDVLILYYAGKSQEEKSLMEDFVERIQEKTEGKIQTINEKEETVIFLKNYRLILIGEPEEAGGLSAVMEAFLQEMDFQGKRVSAFWITEAEEESLNWENEFSEKIKNAVLLPGIDLSAKKEKEKEFSRIDGWLTTAFTSGTLGFTQVE